MNDKYPELQIGPLRFNLANDIGLLVAAVVVFLLVYWLSRNPKIRPDGKQNLLEWVIDFTNGIVKGEMPGTEGNKFKLFSFTMFLFVIVMNQLGLFINVNVNGYTWFHSPTANPLITMTLASIVLILSHYYGVETNGLGGYLKSYLNPINLIEEFTNFMTLSLRLYGNIFAGEILVMLLRNMALSGGLTGILAFPFGFVFEMVWQVFSVFIGSIQAYIFVILGSVYMSHKAVKE
ncbi:F0F1 ATP synthase subunit A [Lacticaseibacillus zhaodongensis]|uniref:F0F1 ATP synthase subunit A n=1 Tax=Lacticaseibacillus zhaodongensis TaxID=2668065 RepID=UPI0012D2A55C|nr:F0F1 ATP synthase subunit A [Lacticaseibacillus zhaodongensis]